MSDALRPSSLFTSAAPATAPSGVLATLPNPPPEVSQLPAGTTLRGTAVGHDDRGHLLVRTDLGTLAVSTKANPPPGSDVVLQIRASGAQLHVLLMFSDTATAGGGARGGPSGGPGGGPGGVPAVLPGGGAQIPDRLTLGNDIRAILQAPAPLGVGSLEPALAAALARLTPGSPIVLRITTVDVPAGAPGGPAGASPPVTTPPGPFIGPTTGPVIGPTAGSVAGPVTGAAPGSVSGQAAGQPASPAPPSAANPGAIPMAGGAPQAGAPGIAGARLSAPHPSASASGPTQAPPSAHQGQAPFPGPVSPSLPGAAQPGSSANPGAAATLAPSVGTAIPPSLRSAASAAGAAYGAAVQPHSGSAPATGGPAAAISTQPGPAQTTAAANTLFSPTPGPPAAGASPATPSLVGVVTATTNAGHPVLQTPIGTLTLEARATLPVGSRVVFQLVPDSLPRGATGLPFESEALPSSLARAWPEVEEAVRVLHESTLPGASGGPGALVIPQPGPRLASGLLFFIAALSGGDVNRWLGDRGTQALKDAGRGSLLARLGQDFGQLSRQVESGGGDWRLFLIPMLDGNQVQQIRFFERHGSHKRGGRGDDQDGESTHFILEVELARLGDMQLDGLVRKQRFDLMLRTHRPLPEAMRSKITEIFNEANDIAGYVGSIGFQASRKWRFMPVAAEALASAGTGLVI